MITTAEFKKQVAKPFGREMRLHGFKGTGFDYTQDTESYLIVVYIEGGRWGGNCSAGFAIHPKRIKKDHAGEKDLSKLKIHRYEFKFGLNKYAGGERWDYADDESTNLATLSRIIAKIKLKAFPLIEKFKSVPNILDGWDVSEMDNFHVNWVKKAGVSIATTDDRFAWAMTMIFENKNPQKARQFADWSLSRRPGGDSKWFADEDFRRVLKKGN